MLHGGIVLRSWPWVKESNAMLLASWLRTWRSLGASGEGIPLMQKLTAAYAEPQRSYHTIQHLSESLA
jgi:predicted metal-dependent HD superfamily phosphohydrolase